MVSYFNIDTNQSVRSLAKAKEITRKKFRGDVDRLQEWGKVSPSGFVTETVLINGAGQIVARV